MKTLKKILLPALTLASAGIPITIVSCGGRNIDPILPTSEIKWSDSDFSTEIDEGWHYYYRKQTDIDISKTYIMTLTIPAPKTGNINHIYYYGGIDVRSFKAYREDGTPVSASRQLSSESNWNINNTTDITPGQKIRLEVVYWEGEYPVNISIDFGGNY